MSMSTIYSPRVQLGGSYLLLPTPFYQTPEDYGKRVDMTDLPTENGEVITSARIRALNVSFSGVIRGEGATSALRRKSVLDTKETLVDWLLKNTTPFHLFRYFNASSGVYRWYENCEISNLRFENDRSTITYLPYNFSLIVPSGVECRKGTIPSE